MHTIFHTDAIVLHAYPTNEANKTIVLFTRELGVVRARAQGIRKSGAKLGAHVVEYSIIRADLVKGRGQWRMTTAKVVKNPSMEHVTAEHKRAYVRMLGLVERFLGDESPQAELFDHIIECSQLLLDMTLDVKTFDTIILWKCMVFLGYVSIPDELQKLFSAPLVELVTYVQEHHNKTLIQQVNNAIQQSHL